MAAAQEVKHIDDLPESYHGFLRPQIRAWFDEVQIARSKAYCPYSSFPVGALAVPKPPHPSNTTPLPTNLNTPTANLPTSSSQISPLTPSATYLGANIENAAYPVGTCAERVAIANAVIHGGINPGGLAAMVVITKNEEAASPCGMCRQFINEFCGKDVPVFMFGAGGKLVVRTVGELLPLGFGPGDLK